MQILFPLAFVPRAHRDKALENKVLPKMRYRVPLKFQLLLFVCFRIWSHFQDQRQINPNPNPVLPIKILAALNPNALLRLWIDPD